MKLLIVLCLIFPTPLYAQSAPLTLNPMTEVLASITPAPAETVADAEVKAYLKAKDAARNQRLADLETDWQQRKAVMDAQMRVLQTAVEYADSAVKAAESAAIASQYVPRPIYPLYPTYPVYPKASYLCVSRPVQRNTTYVWCQ